MKLSPPKHRKTGPCIVCGSTMPEDAAPNAKMCSEQCRRRKNREHKRQVNNAKNALIGKPPVVERKQTESEGKTVKPYGRPQSRPCSVCGEMFTPTGYRVKRKTCSVLCAEQEQRVITARAQSALVERIPSHVDERLRDVLMRSREL